MPHRKSATMLNGVPLTEYVNFVRIGMYDIKFPNQV